MDLQRIGAEATAGSSRAGQLAGVLFGDPQTDLTIANLGKSRLGHGELTSRGVTLGTLVIRFRIPRW